MVKFWERMTIRQRVSLAISIVVVLGFIGSFIWSYSGWPMSALFIVGIIVDGVLRNRNGIPKDPRTPNAHPQENDPNRR
jgi:hypothetical protein